MLYSFRGLKIHYSDSGSGKAIVLIHGFLETMKVWEKFAERLSPHFRVIVIDLPGHGQSDPAGDINTMEIFAEAIRELLDVSGVSKAFLVGHSMGGYATLAFVQLFPEYISGYSLFHSHPVADIPETIEKRKLNIKIIEEGRKEIMIPDFVRGLYAKTNLEKFREAIEISVKIASTTADNTIIADLKGMMARPSRAEVITKSKVPFLWILGTMDSHINHETILQNIRLPENSQVVILKNSGHMGFIEEEELSARIVSEFADKL
ncbi:MAG TPA: alpha/beta hydrolase [Bacteroidales bacterium]|nr:alpha/beta hydrolase [Bacteroidales bacterium]